MPYPFFHSFLGLGASIFDSIFQYVEGADKNDEEEKHMLLTVGTVDFMGFRAKEITPNQEFCITTYSDKVPAVDYDAYILRIGGVAFAGRYGISRVQVSLDGGKTWAEANVKAPLSKWVPSRSDAGWPDAPPSLASGQRNTHSAGSSLSALCGLERAERVGVRYPS